MKLDAKTVLILVALGWVVLRKTRPKWYDDLMLRAFASEQYTADESKQSREQFEKAADVASRFVLPLGWMLTVAEKVQDGSVAKIAEAAARIQKAVLKLGPPADTQPATLAAYKDAVFKAAGVV
jgi:hypothetical protein